MKRLAVLTLPLVLGACWPSHHHQRPTVGYPPTSVATWGVQAPGNVELNVGPSSTTTTAFVPVISNPPTPDTVFVPAPFPVIMAPQPVWLPPPYEPTTTTTELPTTTTEPPSTTTTTYPTPPNACWVDSQGHPACA